MPSVSCVAFILFCLMYLLAFSFYVSNDSFFILFYKNISQGWIGKGKKLTPFHR